MSKENNMFREELNNLVEKIKEDSSAYYNTDVTEAEKDILKKLLTLIDDVQDIGKVRDVLMTKWHELDNNVV